MKSIWSLVIFLAATASGQTHAFKGTWITRTNDSAVKPAPLLRNRFTLHKPVQQATLFVAGLGYHITTVNGQSVTTAVLEQAFTRYDKRVLYQTYNVTRLLQSGENVLGVELGNSWYNMQSHTIWFFDRMPWRQSPRLLLNLVLQYKDGSSDTIATGPHWKTATGASLFNSLHAGELYDALKDIPGWNKPGFNDSQWSNALVAKAPAGILYPQTMPSIALLRRITPVSMKQLAPNRFLYDMGENFAGVVKLRVQANAGDTITLRYSELLTPDGSLDRQQNAGHMLYEPGEPRFATDRYICTGSGVETYIPRFTYHGFQYVEVEADAPLSLTTQSIEGQVYSTNFATKGHFNSTDTLLNKLYKAALQSYRSNYLSIPTDCPQREKMGWLADAHLAAELGLWNYDAAAAYRKYLDDIGDVQLPDGSLPGIAPTNRVGYRWIDPADPDFGPAWGSAYPLIAWYVYLYTGDSITLQRHYPAIRRYVNYLAARARNTGYLYTTGLGDFLSVQATPKAFTSSVYFYQDLVLLSKMAGIVHDQPAVQQYRRLADTVKAAFLQQHFDATTGKCTETTLTALSMALVHELYPAGHGSQVAEQLVQAVRQRQYKADFGMLGTKHVLQALSDHGYVDDAYRLLTDTTGGWGRWIAQGATTLWEGWQPNDQSYNHVYSGDFVAWYYKTLAGIRPCESHPGFTHFTLHPKWPKGLRELRAQYLTATGPIKVHWKRGKHAIRLRIAVPPRTSASLLLPGLEQELSPGHHRFNLPQ